MARATTRTGDTGAPPPQQPTFASAVQREKQQREAALEASKRGFDAEMVAAEDAMVEQIRSETRDYAGEDMEPGDVGFDVPDMSDLPSPELYGTAAWGREQERRMQEQISATTTSEIRRDLAERRPSAADADSYAPGGDVGELSGEALIEAAFRAESGR